MTTAYRIAGVLKRSIKPEPDPAYLAFIRTQPCCVSGSCGPRGIGQKSDARLSLPLSRPYHLTRSDSYHKLGPVKFTQVHNLDVKALILEYNALYVAQSKRPKKPISRVRLKPADLMEDVS